VQVLGACQDWKELVEEEGHAAFQKYAKEVRAYVPTYVVCTHVIIQYMYTYTCMCALMCA
jgi:hypothetical protein